MAVTCTVACGYFAVMTVKYGFKFCQAGYAGIAAQAVILIVMLSLTIIHGHQFLEMAVVDCTGQTLLAEQGIAIDFFA